MKIRINAIISVITTITAIIKYFTGDITKAFFWLAVAFLFIVIVAIFDQLFINQEKK